MATKDITDLDCCIAASFGFGNGGKLRTGDALVYRTGQPEKVCQRALERAMRRGYLDCGINEWNAFLTDKGRELLAQPFEVRGNYCQSCGIIATRHLPEDVTSFPGAYCNDCGV